MIAVRDYNISKVHVTFQKDVVYMPYDYYALYHISERCSIHALCLFCGDHRGSTPQAQFLVLLKIAAK